jgi:putative copper export protein
MKLTNLITETVLASAFVGGCAVVFVLRTIKTVKDRRDSNRIYEVLRRFAKDGQDVFRSSGMISGITNLTQSRISDLCSKHPHIERKEHERHMWRVVN